jgi:hypothetical protein
MRRAAIQEEAFYTTPVFRTAVSGDVDTFSSGLQLISHSSSRDLIFLCCAVPLQKGCLRNWEGASHRYSSPQFSVGGREILLVRRTGHIYRGSGIGWQCVSMNMLDIM